MRGCNNRLRGYMLRGLGQRSRQPQYLGLTQIAGAMDSMQARLSERQGAGLVEQQSFDARELFKGLRRFHHHAAARTPRHSGNDRHRHRENQRARRRHDQDRQSAPPIIRKYPRSSSKQNRREQKTQRVLVRPPRHRGFRCASRFDNLSTPE
jgi:hypothetical protein